MTYRSGFYRLLAVSLALHAFIIYGSVLHRHERSGVKPVAFVDLGLSLPRLGVSAPSAAKTAPRHSRRLIAVRPAVSIVAPTKAKPPVSSPLQTAANQEMADRSAIEFGATNGYFSTLANGETLHDDLRAYYLSVLDKINATWWLDPKNRTWHGQGLIVSLIIDRSGEIEDVRLDQSSGDRSQDLAVRKTLEKAGPLPPLPISYRGNFFLAPLRFTAPLTLFRS